MNRYDIVVIQEVRDSHLTAVGKLLDNLNEWVPGSAQGWEAARGPGALTSCPSDRKAPDTFHYVVSEQLGRSSYKERYLFVFR